MANPATRWIVQGDEVASGRLMERLKGDSAVTPVRQIAKDVLVLAMSAERADQLKKEFGARLVVEPDADLKLNSGPRGP
jgi:hypothetical protein